jgi:hypothetical protein
MKEAIVFNIARIALCINQGELQLTMLKFDNEAKYLGLLRRKIP